MYGLQIELILGFDRHETHARPLHRFGNPSASMESLLLVLT
jgi:hypothetical protein